MTRKERRIRKKFSLNDEEDEEYEEEGRIQEASTKNNQSKADRDLNWRSNPRDYNEDNFNINVYTSNTSLTSLEDIITSYIAKNIGLFLQKFNHKLVLVPNWYVKHHFQFINLIIVDRFVVLSYAFVRDFHLLYF